MLKKKEAKHEQDEDKVSQILSEIIEHSQKGPLNNNKQ